MFDIYILGGIALGCAIEKRTVLPPNTDPKLMMSLGFLCTENLQLGWRFRKAFSFEPVIKTPFDLLKQFAVWQLQRFNKK
ncbi:hypothetical protein, partial [Serratia fonticola]|uniref:hypothetical protein n=1 Tax=Serratia fonticola TaxID=47917 RepID=UPI0021B7404D